ncbi:MAG: hypothetical protein NTY02_09330 [Acidobacteria bacterium]|nr:hypothetical protein [Acidobacteriota bacterium]
MGWLKKIGIILAKSAEILAFGGPVISALIPGKRDDQIVAVAQSVIGQAIQVVVQVEAFGAALALSGADKLKAAVGPIAEILLQFLKGRKIHDAAKFRAGVEKFTAGLADILSSLDDGGIETDSAMK